MEPRPHERGKLSTTPRLNTAHLLQWSHVLTNVERLCILAKAKKASNCFNGATSSRTWKASQSYQSPLHLYALQWSHVLTNVERFPARLPGAVAGAASMEPRPHERGKLVACPLLSCGYQLLQWSHVLTNVESVLVPAHTKRARWCFNGATSSRTWKGCAKRQGTKWITRFNGATSSRTWKGHQYLSGWPGTSTMLQWSHVLTNVER